MKPMYSYDIECAELAAYFLADEIATDRAKQTDVQELAQTIQDAIEMWFVGRTELRAS